MFAGYGGASWGLRKANINFECVGFSEIKKSAIKCYEQNFPNVKCYGDCTKINPEDLPDFNLLTGGFPCQTFSIAGDRKGFDDERGNMFKEIIKIAEYKKPEYMVLENVEGLLNHDKGYSLQIILHSIKEIGYDVQYKLLLSSDYGIPQNRKRVFFICRRKKFNFGETFFPEKVEEKDKLDINNIIEKDVDEKYYLNEEYIKKIKSRTRFGDHHILQQHRNELHVYQKIFPCFTCVDTSNIYIYIRIE
jgi:DNA (cytosine-5)-methyltransferase 1